MNNGRKTLSWKAEKHFGMALGRMNLPLLNVRDFLDIPSFDALEIPAECFDASASDLLRKLNPARFSCVHCGSILERRLCRNVPYCGKALREEFIHEAGRVLERIASVSPVRTAAFGCGMNTVLENEEASRNAEEIIRKLSPMLLRRGMTLLLPFRVPSQTDVRPEDMMRFLRNCLVPPVKVCLEIHPHELPRDFSPPEYAGLLRFETQSVMFVYDADSGNRLVPGHILPWIEYLDPVGMDGPFFSCPQSQDQRMSVPEADSFAKFVSRLRSP